MMKRCLVLCCMYLSVLAEHAEYALRAVTLQPLPPALGA